MAETDARLSTGAEDALADQAMQEIWRGWLSFYESHFRSPSLTISMADQQAFYEIAQPVLRRLASSVRAQLQPQWQPIETAPKDGTRVWVFVPDFDPNEYVATYAHTDIPKEHPDYWEGWSFADEVLLNHCSGEGLEPSHWMPLPDRPALPSTPSGTEPSAPAPESSR